LKPTLQSLQTKTKNGEQHPTLHNFKTKQKMKKELKDEWTPQAGEWVLVSNDNVVWDKRLFVCVWKDKYRCEALGSTDYIIAWQHIRQIKHETMTLQEVRDALGKPNLVIE
jgi:hypothetical protein